MPNSTISFNATIPEVTSSPPAHKKLRVQYWTETYEKYDSPKEFITLAEDFKHRSGYTCGVMDRTQGEESLFSLAGEVSDHPRNRMVLDILAPHLHQALSHVSRGRRVHPAASRSGREQEVPMWIMEGKSSWDISVILGISERTVKFHPAAILNKLGAANRAQAHSRGTIEKERVQR